MSDGNRLNGKGPQNLHLLAGSLPSMVGGMEEGKIGGKGRAPMVPNIVCKICSAAFGKSPDGMGILFKICAACDTKLKSGFVAITCLNRDPMFVKPPSEHPLFKDVGTIVNVSMMTMDALIAKYEAKKKATHTDETPQNPA